MFHATLDSTKSWKQIVDALATLLTEIHLVVSYTGITLTQYDSSRAAMVDLTLPRNVFQEYECTGEHDICLGVDDIVKVSKRMTVDDKLVFDLDTSENRLQIKMIGHAVRTFKLQLLTPPIERTQKLVPSFDVKAEMHADAFKHAVKDIGVFSNHLKVTARYNTLSFAGEGDTGESEVVLSLGDESLLYSLSTSGEVSSMYALSYLNEITKAIPSDNLMLQMTSNRPILIEFPIAENGMIRYLLAPRVERR
ncbi:proliferating cell nuclear antigen (pcna) [Candidatus Thorarchaeota archaeon]|nr:MAG: proliferating cell nuclear antigen (pcna) [Candidatus Thorarchaeota archaeon]